MATAIVSEIDRPPARNPAYVASVVRACALPWPLMPPVESGGTFLAEGLSCGLHKIERLMRAQALRARPRRRALPKDTGLHTAAVAPNVLSRQFVAERPNQKWIAGKFNRSIRRSFPRRNSGSG